MLDPNSHARLKVSRLSLWIEAQAKRVAVMIPNYPFGLPGGERSERPQFGDDGFDRALGAVPHYARGISHRETIEVIFAHIEREPLLARRLDHQDRLARANILAHLCGDDADHTVGRSTQDHLVKTALEHSDRSGRGLHLRVGARAFLPTSEEH